MLGPFVVKWQPFHSNCLGPIWEWKVLLSRVCFHMPSEGPGRDKALTWIPFGRINPLLVAPASFPKCLETGHWQHREYMLPWDIIYNWPKVTMLPKEESVEAMEKQKGDVTVTVGKKPSYTVLSAAYETPRNGKRGPSMVKENGKPNTDTVMVNLRKSCFGFSSTFSLTLLPLESTFFISFTLNLFGFLF